MKTIETDVVIMGGGGAGLSAALHAHDAGLRVLLVSKSLAGRGGCSAILGFTGSGVSVRQSLKNIDQALDDKVNYYSHYLGNQEYMKASSAAGRESLNDLERMGVYFRRTDDGELVAGTRDGYGLVAPRWGNTGKGAMDVVRSHVFARQVPLLEEAMVTNLLTADGRVIGATIYDYRRGELVAARAKAVIIATGQVDYLWKRSTATREQAGNGLAVAFRAGAELEELEQKWWHIGDMAYPRLWQRMHCYPNPIPMTWASVADPAMQIAHFHNSAGELFFHSNMHPKAQPSYYLQAKYLMQQVYRGLARVDGGYFVSYRHIDPALMKEYTLHWRFFERLGLDPSKDVMECAMCSHQMRGGIRLYPGMRTNVPGLFLAGAVAASYISGLLNVFWEGKQAARAVGDWVRGVAGLDVNVEAERAEEARIQGMADNRPGQGVIPAVVKQMIREAMWEYMPYAKTGAKMQAGLEELRRIRREVTPRMVVPGGVGRFGWNLVEALDVVDMLTCCELDVLSGLERRESRGGFYREDYPYTDNDNWLKNIVLQKGHDNGGVNLQLVPVDLKYVRPPAGRVDFLTSES